MKLSEYRGEDALDILAELIEPAAEIFGDKEFSRQYKIAPVKAVKWALKNKAKAVITILAVLDGEDPAEYKPNILTLPAKLLELLNDPDRINLFTMQAQNTEATFSGSAMETTGETGAE